MSDLKSLVNGIDTEKIREIIIRSNSDIIPISFIIRQLGIKKIVGTNRAYLNGMICAVAKEEGYVLNTEEYQNILERMLISVQSASESSVSSSG